MSSVSDASLCVCVWAGLLVLLLILLEWTRPGLLTPLRPICDLRVLNHFIQEARDAEVAMVRGEEASLRVVSLLVLNADTL